MKIRLTRLELKFAKADVTLDFADVSYFYGQMGAGKSSIARLVDYCMGGTLEATPALQSEFISVVLHFTLGSTAVAVRRERDADFAFVHTTLHGQEVDLKVPARRAAGEIIKGSKIEVLSDLIFVLAGITPPKVRKSRYDDAADMGRLSLRDLLWFCYLDQDDFDSNFFHLGHDNANLHKRNKSREVLRYVLGFHQEEVSALEQEIEYVRNERQACETAMVTLRDALLHAKIGSDFAWHDQRKELKQKADVLTVEIAQRRKHHDQFRPHAAEAVQKDARLLTEELGSLREAIGAVQKALDRDQRHADELRSLSFRHKRATSARAVLEGVEFHSCPRCTQALPARSAEACPLCGQPDNPSAPADDSSKLDRDIQDRLADLEELAQRQKSELVRLEEQELKLTAKKQQVDETLNRLLAEYDSAYLSNVLELEREKARVEEEMRNVEQVGRLIDEVTGLEKKLTRFRQLEAELAPKLREARQLAEKDLSNLERLRVLFRDCLVRSQLAGFTSEDIVDLSPKDFLPEVSKLHEVATSSFANMGSGGKKTIFKCCFALALHRLNAEIHGPLPTFLVIDSPMKNISERENREQFESFHRLLYDLAQSELRDLQFILVDKEMFPPPEKFARTFACRHMKPDDPENPPLIPYYRGH